MNALQTFIAALPGGFINSTEKRAKLQQLDRLCPVLVRCGGCRFTCAVQDVEHLISCVTAGGDYVRDVSLPVGSMERAANWVDQSRYSTTDGRTIQRDGKTVGVIRLNGTAHLHASIGHAYDDTIMETNIGL